MSFANHRPCRYCDKRHRGHHGLVEVRTGTLIEKSLFSPAAGGWAFGSTCRFILWSASKRIPCVAEEFRLPSSWLVFVGPCWQKIGQALQPHAMVAVWFEPILILGNRCNGTPRRRYEMPLLPSAAQLFYCNISLRSYIFDDMNQVLFVHCYP